MSKIGSSQVFGALFLALVVTSCGVDDSPVDEPVMGDDTPAGDDAPAGDDDTPAPAPTAETDYPTTDVTTLPEGAYECTYTAPPNQNITDFSIWNEGGSTVWGDDMSLTGGTFQYQDAASDELLVEVDTAAGTAHITGTVTNYAGWGLWFGPCTNAYQFAGVQFMVGGTIGEFGQLQFQVQQNNNYPIDTEATKGACAGDWNEPCASNFYDFAEFPAEPAMLQVTWADLAGGAPNPMEQAEILGIQWQFNCEEGETCEVGGIL